MMRFKCFFIFFLFLLIFVTPLRVSPAKEPNTLSIPKAPWTLVLKGSGFEVQVPQIRGDGKGGYLSLRNKGTGVSVILTVDPVEDRCHTSKECADFVLEWSKRKYMNVENVVQSETKEYSIVSFFVPEANTVPVKQQHLIVERIKDGFQVEMRISKTGYQPKDEKLLREAVKELLFVKK